MMVRRKSRIRHFDYTPLYYKEEERNSKGERKIRFKRPPKNTLSGPSIFRLAMIFIVAAVLYFFARYPLKRFFENLF